VFESVVGKPAIDQQVAGISETIAVEVRLSRVGRVETVVADVIDTISVRVDVRVRYRRTGVHSVADAIAVTIPFGGPGFASVPLTVPVAVLLARVAVLGAIVLVVLPTIAIAVAGAWAAAVGWASAAWRRCKQQRAGHERHDRQAQQQFEGRKPVPHVDLLHEICT